MTLIRRRNGGLIPSFRSSLSELFDSDLLMNPPIFETPYYNRFSKIPGANIRETDNEFIVEVAAPGMKKKAFKVDIDNNMLEIKVEKEEEKKEDKESYTRREYDYTAFYRSFNLPDTVQSEKIKAEYEDGILKVHLPKVAEAKRKPAKEIAIS
jgi:HSP20 family protein